MSDIDNPLDKFGKFIVENMRDKGIEFYDKLAKGLWKALSLKLLQEDLKQFDEEQLSIIRQCIVASIDDSIHNFLFALQESSDMNNDVQVVVDGHNVGKLSDGLPGELYTEDGWYSKYSSFRENDKMKSTNIYVIHGYTSSSQSEWFPWLKEQVKNRQVKINIPNMPDSKNPHLETWLNHLRKNVLDINENTIFIGHSLGSVTALRYILEKNIKIKGAILVSGFINENPMDEQTEGLQEFVDEPLDIARIKNLIPSRIVITATDDDIVPTEATQKLAEALDANLIILSSGKHFIARDGYTDFPVLLKEIQKLIN